MVQKIQSILIDDVDGTEANETIRFTLDRVSYEIDLNDKHAAELRADFAAWVKAARKTGSNDRASRRSAGASVAARRKQLDEIRAWARAQGKTVGDRGRVPVSIENEYNEAHGLS